MFRIFSSKKITTKPHIAYSAVCNSYFVFSAIYQLSNGLILSIGRDEDRKNTELVLINPVLKQRVAENRLKGGYTVTALLSNNRLLLHTGYNDDYEILDCNTLNIVDQLSYTKINSLQSQQKWLPLENNRFASIERPQYKENELYRIIIHDLNTKQYNQIASLPLPIDKGEDAYCYQLTRLTKHQFACTVIGTNSNYFQVLLFERTPGNEHEFKFAGLISPEQGKRIGSSASGDFAVLPNGNILTYHQSGKNFQVWQDTKCIDHWSWEFNHESSIKGDKASIQCNDKYYQKGFWTKEIFPMPDYEHLLILTDYKLFMFNMKTRDMKPVDLGKLYPCEVSVCADGQTIIRARKPDETTTTLLMVEFKEMLAYKTAYALRQSETPLVETGDDQISATMK